MHRMGLAQCGGASAKRQIESRTYVPRAYLQSMFRWVVYILAFLSPQPEVTTLVEYWQRVLHLEEWQITVALVGSTDLDKGTLGDIEPDRSRRSAVMRVRHAHESDLRGRYATSEMNNTILHEMVHLRLFADGDPEWGNEAVISEEAGRLIRTRRRWLEMLTYEP
jgi:hypothetical protein